MLIINDCCNIDSITQGVGTLSLFELSYVLEKCIPNLSKEKGVGSQMCLGKEQRRSKGGPRGAKQSPLFLRPLIGPQIT